MTKEHQIEFHRLMAYVWIEKGKEYIVDGKTRTTFLGFKYWRKRTKREHKEYCFSIANNHVDMFMELINK